MLAPSLATMAVNQGLLSWASRGIFTSAARYYSLGPVTRHPALFLSGVKETNWGPVHRTFASVSTPESPQPAPQKQDSQQGSGGDAAQGHGDSLDAHASEYMFRHNTVTYSSECLGVKPKHIEPARVNQRLAYAAVFMMRWGFDRITGYKHGVALTQAQWLRRMIFLETVAGVPGMVGGMLRHLRSLRAMKRDNGWISTLLDEAENERMHLLTFMEIRKPGPLFRAGVILAQGIFFNLYFTVYLVSPRTCHSFVGYLEEEAVKTYTHALQEIEAGRLWPDQPAPEIARQYWALPDNATMKDVILAVRADEAKHSEVNHTFGDLKADDPNPYARESHTIP